MSLKNYFGYSDKLTGDDKKMETPKEEMARHNANQKKLRQNAIKEQHEKHEYKAQEKKEHVAGKMKVKGEYRIHHNYRGGNTCDECSKKF